MQSQVHNKKSKNSSTGVNIVTSTRNSVKRENFEGECKHSLLFFPLLDGEEEERGKSERE